MYVQPQAQLIQDLSHIVLMLFSSNHKGYFDMQNILSELLETNCYYPEGFILDLHPDREFQTDILKIRISVSAL